MGDVLLLVFMVVQCVLFALYLRASRQLREEIARCREEMEHPRTVVINPQVMTRSEFGASIRDALRDADGPRYDDGSGKAAE